eukprot:3602478-Rhodomonas_salina.2
MGMRGFDDVAGVSLVDVDGGVCWFAQRCVPPRRLRRWCVGACQASRVPSTFSSDAIPSRLMRFPVLTWNVSLQVGWATWRGLQGRRLLQSRVLRSPSWNESGWRHRLF